MHNTHKYIDKHTSYEVCDVPADLVRFMEMTEEKWMLRYFFKFRNHFILINCTQYIKYSYNLEDKIDDLNTSKASYIR